MNSAIYIAIITLLISIAGLFKDIGATINHRKIFNASIILLFLLSFPFLYFSITNETENDMEKANNAKEIESLKKSQEDAINMAKTIKNNTDPKNQIENINKIIEILQKGSEQSLNKEQQTSKTIKITPDKEDKEMHDFLSSLLVDDTMIAKPIEKSPPSINIEEVSIEGDLHELIKENNERNHRNVEVKLNKDEVIPGISSVSTIKNIFDAFGRPTSIVITKPRILLKYDEAEFIIQNKKITRIRLFLSHDGFKLENNIYPKEEQLNQFYGKPNLVRSGVAYYTFDQSIIGVKLSESEISSLTIEYTKNITESLNKEDPFDILMED